MFKQNFKSEAILRLFHQIFVLSCRIYLQIYFQLLLRAIDLTNVITASKLAEAKIFTLKKANVIPIAKASMLVAMAKIHISLKPNAVTCFFFTFKGFFYHSSAYK